MTRRLPSTKATQEKFLAPLKEHCGRCGQLLWVAEHKHRTITTLDGVYKLISVIRWCSQPDCPDYHLRQYPEEEWWWAPPRSKFGWDIIVAIGRAHLHRGLRGSEISRSSQESGINITRRSVTNWIYRYREAYEDEKDGWHPSDRMKAKLQQQGQVILSIELFRLRDDYNILGMISDCLSGEMLLVYTPQIMSSPSELKVRLRRVQHFLSRIDVPVKSWASITILDKTLINSVLAVFPEAPYQSFNFPTLPILQP